MTYDSKINIKNLPENFTFRQFVEKEIVIKEAIDWHLENKVPFFESVFRVGSNKYFELWREAREMYKKNLIQLHEVDRHLIETDIGEIVEFDGKMVPLDCPMINEEKENDKKLNTPKRGGSKKFYVYVKKPDGGIKKVSWGDTTGLSIKMNNPEARKSFAARHKCSTKKDRTKASYWACNTPRYAKSLGLSGGGSFYW